MPLSRFDRRIRIVSFRLSEREYTAIKQFCDVHGLRGISDLARRAIHHWFAGNDMHSQRSVLMDRVGESDDEPKERPSSSLRLV